MFDIPFEYSEIFTIIMYFAPALISLMILYFAKRKMIWLSIPITIIFDILAFGKALVNYEFWQLTLVFLIPQIAVVAIISFIVMYINKKRTAHTE